MKQKNNKLTRIRKLINSIPDWYHQIELAPGLITPGINDSSSVLKQLRLPRDCRGMKVLDLGTRDGFFAFELEKRGAEVIAVDYVPKKSTGFDQAFKILKGKKVKYIQDNIYNITPKKYGQFDIVLFLGLLYHLPDPLRALKLVRSVCRDLMYIETQGIDNAFLMPNGSFIPLSQISARLSEIPIMQFYPNDTLKNDPSNYWAPNMACLVGMLEETGFKIKNKKINANRLIVKCTVASPGLAQKVMDIATGDDIPVSW